MGYYEPEPSRYLDRASTRIDSNLVDPQVFDPIGFNPDTKYLLPHEYIALREAINQMRKAQGDLGDLLGDAMDQSSETFHDNAPQEVIVAESIVLAKRAEPYIRALGKLQVVHYPSADDAVVTIGKRVGLRLNGKLGYSIDVVGASWLYKEVLEEDVDITSYDSPIAKAVLGKGPGKLVGTTINDRAAEIEILDLRNTPHPEI